MGVARVGRAHEAAEHRRLSGGRRLVEADLHGHREDGRAGGGGWP